MGLSYHHSLEGQIDAFIDYYVFADQGENKVRAIQCDIRFPDPLSSDEVYQECQRAFNRRYGPAVQGSYGSESWQEARAQGVLEAHLRLSESQEVLSINLLLVPNT